MSYFIAVVKYDKTRENGAVHRVSEQYLCNALSCTEAEAIVTENLRPYISGDFLTTSVKASKITDVIGDTDCGRFYITKVAFITIDERTAKEKKTVSQWLVGGANFNDAYEMVLHEINKCMADIEIQSLTETPIKEFYPAKL